MDTVIRMRDFKRNFSVESEPDTSGDEHCNETLQDHVYLAEKEDRLIKGIFESAHALEICPELVEFCILPSGKSKTISTDIQHKLIQAFCWENNIKIAELAKADFSNMVNINRHKTVENTEVDCLLITTKPYKDFAQLNDHVSDLNEKFG